MNEAKDQENVLTTDNDENMRVKKITVSLTDEDVIKKFININRTKNDDRTD